MPSSTRVLSILAASAALAYAADGPAFSTGPTSSDTFITEATATLVLPKAPTNNKEGDLSLWVGMGTSNGDLIQSIAENYESSDWSIYAYTLVSTSADSQAVVQSSESTAEAKDEVTMHYKYDSTTGNYTQYVSLNGNLVHTLSTSDGEAQGWGSAVECADTNCGTVPAHKWINTKIILSGADPSYNETMGKGEGVTGSMTTSDGGITWDIGTIGIPEYTFTDSK